MDPEPRATWALPERLDVAHNESVARFIERVRPSAHSDVATELALAAEELPGIGTHCPDPARYAYVVLHDGAGRIFALAFGMRGFALRVGADAMDEAIADGAEADPGIGEGWVVFDPFRVDERTGAARARLKRWTARAFGGGSRDLRKQE